MTYEVMKQYGVWDCPFYGRNTISIIHFHKSVAVKCSKTASLRAPKGFVKNPDIYIIKSGCVKCGANLEEVKRKFKEAIF